MDNDGKMNPKPADEATGTDLVEQTKAYFLQVAMDEFRTAQERYNLNDEFAKTKRNRNFVVLLVVSATIIGFGLFAFLFNNHVETQSNKVSISTQEFDDINLRDLLDKAKVLESDLALRQAELKNLSDNTADLQVKKEELDRKLNTRIQAIQQAAAEAEKPIQAAITQLKAELATFDSRKLEVAKKQEVVLNNERRVYDIERERMQTLLENQIAKLSADYDAQIKRRDAFIKDLETPAARSRPQSSTARATHRPPAPGPHVPEHSRRLPAGRSPGGRADHGSQSSPDRLQRPDEDHQPGALDQFRTGGHGPAAIPYHSRRRRGNRHVR